MGFASGPRNLLTDVAGLRVGNAHDEKLKSGVTAVLCDVPTVASYMVLGGAPGTRDTDLLEPHNTVETVNAIVLSGGSAFGLDAAAGVQADLREKGIGFDVAGHIVPIVPAAILFDLANGGDKNWGDSQPYRVLGKLAAARAAESFDIGTAGAGAGATTADLKGGLGSASAVLENGVTVAALVAVNAVGSTNVGGTASFWAAPFEQDGEFGGLGFPHPIPDAARDVVTKLTPRPAPGANTTIAVIATDAKLSKAAARRLAIAAHDGYARAIWPAHTAMDGDLIFALATGTSDVELGVSDVIALHAAASSAMARAIARGVHAATPSPGDLLPVWSQRAENS